MNLSTAYRVVDSLFTLSEFRPYTFLLLTRSDSLEKKLDYCKKLTVTQDDKIKDQDATLLAGMETIQTGQALLSDCREDNKKLQQRNEDLQGSMGGLKIGGGVILTIAIIEGAYILLNK